MNTRNLLAIIAAGTLAAATAACNTVSGAGEDLQSASQDVKEEI
jgi:predicted small secreted protein